MRIVIIGDTHGEDNWKKILRDEDRADHIVFIGDYFDSFYHSGEEQILNFQSIVSHKLHSPERYTLLIGNHDFHYICPGERYSGYNDRMAFDFRDAVDGAIKDGALQMAKHIPGETGDGYLLTHAGVTRTWLKNNGISELATPSMLAQLLHNKFLVEPLAFAFDRRDLSGCGEDKRQSPIWVRPEALLKDMYDSCVQIVGHTPQNKLTPDAILDLIISDSRRQQQYIAIEDGKRYAITV